MTNLMYDEIGLLVVKENHCCEHFEPDDKALVPMKECWCCKWSNFRGEGGGGTYGSTGICSYVGNAREMKVVNS